MSKLTRETLIRHNAVMHWVAERISFPKSRRFTTIVRMESTRPLTYHPQLAQVDRRCTSHSEMNTNLTHQEYGFIAETFLP